MSVPRIARPSWAWSLSFAATMLACRPSEVPRARAPLAVQDVEPEYRDDWREVVRAQAQDPAGDEVVAAANRLLGRHPPAPLQAAAWLAKAQQALLIDADDRAINWSDEGLAAGADPETDTAVRNELWRVSVTALARGGDPARAVQAIAQAGATSDLSTVELRGATAVALDRAGDEPGALVAFAAWRELLDANAAEAAYAERRFAALAAQHSVDDLGKLADKAPSSGVAACLHAAAGDALPSVGANWTVACRRLPQRIGILLPRSGALAGLSDRHLAAVTASVRVLADEREVELLWEDAGSDAVAAKRGAKRLVGRGAQVVIGPVARANVAAAVAELQHIPVVLPGEPVAEGWGVASTLEDRTARLFAHAQAQRGRHPIIVLAPENAYGRRAVNALPRSGGATIRFYPSTTTTFKPHLEADLGRIRAGAPVLVLDAMPRLELIVRQLRSLGVTFGVSGEGAQVLGTGEGLDADLLAAGREVFDGVVLAPAAAPGPQSSAFESEYRRQQGHGADDQALLVWRALRGVWSGQIPRRAVEPQLVRVRGAELVPLETSKQTQ